MGDSTKIPVGGGFYSPPITAKFILGLALIAAPFVASFVWLAWFFGMYLLYGVAFLAVSVACILVGSVLIEPDKPWPPKPPNVFM